MKRPDEDDVRLVRENVMFIYKSFERQCKAKGLFCNVQPYYPGERPSILCESIIEKRETTSEQYPNKLTASANSKDGQLSMRCCMNFREEEDRLR